MSTVAGASGVKWARERPVKRLNKEFFIEGILYPRPVVPA
jgi:hypothetical protein